MLSESFKQDQPEDRQKGKRHHRLHQKQSRGA